MCTVTYLPTSSGFILTHNRDEAPGRSSQAIVRQKTTGGDWLLFPRDTGAGGTWIATSSQGRTACLLNGAFVLHQRNPPYRRSRGLILLDFFDWDIPEDFFQGYNFQEIEPFTFLFFDRSQLSERSSCRVIEFRWDGQQRHVKILPGEEAHFWSSATLYPPEMRVRREQVFRDWLQHNTPNHQSLINLHLEGSIGDPENDFVMNRGGKVQTVSVTQVIVHEKNARMHYQDLMSGNHSQRRLTRNKRLANSLNR